MSSNERKRILLIVSDGGRLVQSIKLHDLLAHRCELHYVMPAVWDRGQLQPRPRVVEALQAKAVPEERTSKIVVPRVHGDTWQHSIQKSIQAVGQSMKIVRQVKPHMIVCVGNAMAAPMFLAGKLQGSRTIFIDSISMTARMTNTATWLSRLWLADQVFVQWPHLARGKRIKFEGSLL